jgi:site-specific recombinase XerD
MPTRLLKQWSDFMRAQGRSDRTIQQYRYALLRLMSEVEGDKDWTEITEQDVVVFLASLGTRAHSKQLYLRAFRSFFGWAAQRGHIEADPSIHLRPKAPSERDPDAFTPAEVVALMASARTFPKGDRRAAAILTAYALGLRRSELCKLEPEDIDWVSRRVHIRESKGGKSRWVESNTLAEQGLHDLEPWYEPQIVGWDPQWFTMIVHDAAVRAGFPPGRRNAHLLRSSFATQLLGEGAPISVVSKLLGHSNIATTARYLSVRAQDRRDAVDRLALPG